MEFKSKILSKRIQDLIYGQGKTLATAESCTGGRIAEAIIATPGASDFFKGGIISYTNEVKENLLGVSHEVIEEQTFAISSTGIAGPAGGTKEIPVGTIWIAYGSKDDIRTFQLTEDFGRDINLAVATNQALQLMLEFLKEQDLNL